jgi:enoyl-CoA hydratase
MSQDLSAESRAETTDTVLLEQVGAVRVLTLNRPHKRNAASFALQQRLLELIVAVDADEAARALVLTGAGESFCAGGDVADLRAAAEGRLANFETFGRLQQDIFDRMLGLRIPAVAAVTGAAAGFGAGLVALCDLVVASDRAVMWDPHTRHGLPATTVLQAVWPRRAAGGVVREILLTGRKVAAEEALRLGLVNRVCRPGEELDLALEWAGSFAEAPPAGFAATKRGLNRPVIDELAALLAGLRDWGR